MAKLWTDILLPLALAGTVAAQTLGVEVNRARVLHAWFPDTKRDTLQVDSARKSLDSLVPVKTSLDSLAKTLPDTLKHLPDSLKPTRTSLDSLAAEEEEFDLFGAEDATPTVFARDTMKVPDSLKVTDPFLYKWYVATKDSYTHRVVIDSLKQTGDSLIWPRVDSLFIADSTLQAQIA